MSDAAPRLSTADLEPFFDAHHQRLAADLSAAPAVGGGDPRDVVRALARDLDALRWLAPDEGAALDVRALCLIREHLAYASPVADALFAVQGLGIYPLWRADRGHFSDLIRRAVRGEEVMAFALTEPGAGSDAAALETRAEPDGDGYRLVGDKTLISNAPIATHFVVFATVDPDAGKRGITAFLVDAQSPGLEVTPTSVTVDHPIGDVGLRGVRVGAGAVVGEVGGGLALALGGLERFRVTVGAAAAGMARRALDETLARVRERRQFGAALAEQPVIQAELADMATELDAARLLVLRAAWDLDHNDRPPPTASAMAKLFATEAAQRVIDRAVQLHGGLGVTRGHVVETLYRAIRPLRIYEGTSQILRHVIGRNLVRD